MTTASDPPPGETRSLTESFVAAAKRVGPVVTALAALSALLPAIGGFMVIAFAGAVRDQMQSLGPSAAPITYGSIFAIATGLALMPTYALSGVAGYIFGTAGGGLVAMLGILGGAVIGYLVAVLLARRAVMRAIEENERARIVRGALVDRGFFEELLVVFLLRLPPNSPFALMNLTLGSTRVRPAVYLLGTAAGIAPRTLAAVVLGASIAAAQKSLDETTATPAWLRLSGIGLTVVVVLVLYVLFSRWSKQALRRHLEPSQSRAGTSTKASGPASTENGPLTHA